MERQSEPDLGHEKCFGKLGLLGSSYRPRNGQGRLPEVVDISRRWLGGRLRTALASRLVLHLLDWHPAEPPK